MHDIDRYAYLSRVRAQDPAAIALLVLLLCLFLDRPPVGLLATVWMVVLSVWWAGLPGRPVIRMLLAEGLSLVLISLGVALSIGLAYPDSLPWRWELGPLWIASGPAQLDRTIGLVSRALGCAAAMNFLALTTPLVDLVDLLRRFRAPTLILDLITVSYRFVFTLLESLERMRTAQECRLGYATAGRGIRSAGLLGSRLFIDAYQRGKRLEIALASRGYAGELRVLPGEHRHDPKSIPLAVGIAASLLLVGVFL